MTVTSPPHTSVSNYTNSCNVLIALLKQHEGPVSGLDKMIQQERLFLTATCAAEVLLHSIAIMAAAEYDDALGGLEAVKLEQRLQRICNEMNKLYDEVTK